MIRTRLHSVYPRLVATALAIAAAGCHGPSALPLQGTATRTTTNTTSTSTQEPGGPKTEFHREVGPEQEYSVHMELARLQEAQGNHEAAAAEYQKAVEVCERKGSRLVRSTLGPEKQSQAQRRMAASLDRLGRFAQAETHYHAALKLAPRDPKVWNDAGYSYHLQNRSADAVRCLKMADQIDPHNPRVLTNLGLALAAAGKDDEALAAFSRAAGPAIGHANLGYILAAMGKTDRAREHYRSALQLQPELNAAKLALNKLDRDHPDTTAIASAPSGPKDSQIARTSTAAAR